MTKPLTYVMTATAALAFVFLNWVFDDGAFAMGDTSIWFSRDGSVIAGTLWTYVMLALIVAAGLVQAARLPAQGVELRLGRETDTPGQIQDPAWWRLLIGNAHLAILWLPLRFYIGRHWLEAGEHKITSDAWMDGGAAIEGFWVRAATPADDGGTLAVYDWYADFLTHMIDNDWARWFGPLIAVGETLVGIGLLVGALVGIAAFFGTVMNVSFMFAGTVSSNPMMFALTVFIVLGWKVAGWWGLDRWLLPMLGTPWYRGEPFGTPPEPKTGTSGTRHVT